MSQQATNRANANRVRFTTLERAQIDLSRALARLSAHRIVGSADEADIEARTDHLRAVYGVFMDYLETVVSDTMDHLGVRTIEVEVAIFESVNGGTDVLGELAKLGCRFGEGREAA